MISTVIGMASSYHSMVTVQIISDSSANAFERMGREIRNSESIDTGNSTFGVSPGVLTLNSTDESGSITREFYVLDGRVRVKEDGVDTGPLTVESVEVVSLVFTRIVSDISEAVKIEMTLEVVNGVDTKSENFYLTVVLRGSYQD